MNKIAQACAAIALVLALSPTVFADPPANKGASNHGQIVSECNRRANERKLKGHDRKEWTEWCEERGSSHKYDYKRYNTDRNCYQKADNKGLSGDKRRKFIDNCLGQTTYNGNDGKHTRDARGAVSQ